MYKDIHILILNTLKKPLTANELSEILNIKKRKIFYHLIFLHNKNLIKIAGIKKTTLKKIPSKLWIRN